MTEAVIAGRAPLPVEVESGRTYWWCACGRSSKQPFCDGSHKGAGLAPLQYDATETKKVWFCACTHTAGPPLCDGTHKKL